MRRERYFAGFTLMAFLALFATSGFMIYSSIRHEYAQFNVSHTSSGADRTGAYPSVASHTITDHRGIPRIVVLHKLTKPLPPSVPNTFRWVDLIAIEPSEGRLECEIEGKPVAVDPDALQVFYAVDDGATEKLTLTDGSFPSFSSPEAAWEDLVERHKGNKP